MNTYTTVTTKGQVTIPEKIRDLLKIEIGDQVLFEQIFPAEKQFLARVIPSKIAEQTYGSLHPKIKNHDMKKIRALAGQSLGKKHQIK